MKSYAFDLDGTLNNREEYSVDELNEEAFMKPEPRAEIVEKVRELKKKGNKIVIFTARPSPFFEVTKRWLEKHKIPFDHIVMGKEFADVYVDDRSVTPERLICKKEIEFEGKKYHQVGCRRCGKGEDWNVYFDGNHFVAQCKCGHSLMLKDNMTSFTRNPDSEPISLRMVI